MKPGQTCCGPKTGRPPYESGRVWVPIMASTVTALHSLVPWRSTGVRLRCCNRTLAEFQRAPWENPTQSG